MQGFFSSPGGGSVQALSLMLVTAALSMGNFLLDMSIETTRGQLIPIAGGGDVLNAQINPDLGRMPQIASYVVDDAAVMLVNNWIQSITTCP